MHTFEVWAPKAAKLTVKIGNNLYPLHREERGWWRGEVAEAHPGTDYSFVVDGQEPSLPDPRSAWQPNGVHSDSQLVDHSRFSWSDDGWQAPPLSGAVVYEMHVGTFTPEGTFSAAESHLQYLKDLGITHVELMPVATFPGNRGWGYDGVDLYAPHSTYGNPAELKHLVDTCHSHGLAVLLDVVYNHLGPVGNYLAKFGPYFSERHTTPWGGAINLEEAGSTEVRRFLVDNALMWLRDYHFDGLRIDAVQAFIDRSAIHLLEQLADEVRSLESQLGRRLVVIAESDLGDPRLVSARQAGGFGLDAQWSDDFHHALFALLTGETNGYYSDFGTIADLAKSLHDVFVYDGVYSEFRGRDHGRPVIGLSAHRFLGYVQNHDQIGNQAKGERLSHRVSLNRAKVAAALVFTAPFVPMLFQGEEFGASAPFQYFTDHDDPEMGRMVSEGRKLEFAPFGWSPEQVPDPQAAETFERSKLNWGEISHPPHTELLQWHKDLIRLRRSRSELSDGNLAAVHVRFDEECQWLVVERGKVRIAANLHANPVVVDLGGNAEILLSSNSSVHLNGDKIELGPDSVAVVAL